MIDRSVLERFTSKLSVLSKDSTASIVGPADEQLDRQRRLDCMEVHHEINERRLGLPVVVHRLEFRDEPLRRRVCEDDPTSELSPRGREIDEPLSGAIPVFERLEGGLDRPVAALSKADHLRAEGGEFDARAVLNQAKKRRSLSGVVDRADDLVRRQEFGGVAIA